MEAEAIGTGSFRRTRGSEKAARRLPYSAARPRLARAPRARPRKKRINRRCVRIHGAGVFFRRRPRMRRIAAAALAPRAASQSTHFITLHTYRVMTSTRGRPSMKHETCHVEGSFPFRAARASASKTSAAVGSRFWVTRICSKAVSMSDRMRSLFCSMTELAGCSRGGTEALSSARCCKTSSQTLTIDDDEACCALRCQNSR